MGTNSKPAFKKSKPTPQKSSQGASKKSSVTSMSTPAKTTPKHSQKQSKPQGGPGEKASARKKPFTSSPKSSTNKKAGSEKKTTWIKGEKSGSWPKKRKAPVELKPFSKKERRAAKKAKNLERPHGAELSKANEVWNIFNAELKKTDRESKIGEILKDLAGKMLPVCCKHDGSRAVQKMIKYGSPAQREQIYKELQGKMVEMSLDKHSHFVVIQLLKCEVEEIRKGVMSELLKRIPKLALHNTAGSVIDYLYASGKPKDRLRILAEFYGTEHALFAKLDQTDTVSSLTEVLKANPTKASVVLSSIQAHLDKCSTKDMYLFRPLHGLIAAYLPHAPPISREQLISICSGKVLALHHSQEGAGVICECLGQGTAKTRKAVLKGLKGRVHEMACHPHGHIILLRALQVVDDIVSLNSELLSKLQPHVRDLLVDPFGAKVLLYVANPQLSGLSTETDRLLLGGEITSKKNPVVRQIEVLLKASTWLFPAILEQLDLISHVLACKVIFETVMHVYYVSDPSYASSEGKVVGADDLNRLAALRKPVMEIVQALAKLLSDEANRSLVEDSNIHHHLKRLLTRTQPSGNQIAEVFSKALAPLLSQPTLPDTWLSNRGSFLLATLAESDDSLKLALKSHIGNIKQVQSAGTKLLVQVLEESAEERVQRLASHKEEPAVALTKALKKKKKKPKKRPVPEDLDGEYKDAAIVGMKPKVSKGVKVLSVANEAKKAKSDATLAVEPPTKATKVDEPRNNEKKRRILIEQVDDAGKAKKIHEEFEDDDVDEGDEGYELDEGYWEGDEGYDEGDEGEYE